MKLISERICLLLAFGLGLGCQVLVDANLDEVACEQEGVIGPPACASGQACQGGICVDCASNEVCGDGVDNDCNGAVDDGCRDAGITPDASRPEIVERTNLRARADQSLVALYAFLAGVGSTIYDLSGVSPVLDLEIATPGLVRWRDNGGVNLEPGARIVSSEHATKIAVACKASNAITVEAWLKPAVASQKGPAQVVSMSVDQHLRNFAFGQDGDAWTFRLRTTNTGGSGEPFLSTGAGVVQPALAHVVYVRNASGHARFIVNGESEGAEEIEGDLSNWEDTFHLVLANEFMVEHPWQGSLYLVAIYNEVLPLEDVDKNLQVGVPKMLGPEE